MKVSIIIPVYNEASTVRQVIHSIRQLPFEKEVIVVDGDSDDGTVQVLEEESKHGDLNVILQKTRNGRGGALQEGMKASTGEIILFQDADLELDPACLPDLILPITEGKAQIVLGSRFLNTRPKMSFLQYWGNRAVTLLINLMWGTSITDSETCYQVFQSGLISGMKFDRTDMSFSIELLLRLISTGATCQEIAVSYAPRTHEEGKKLFWKDGFVSLWVILKYRFRLRQQASALQSA